MINNRKKGRVVFASAGPGEPELLTVKAVRALAQADVILADRLASPDILAQYANPQAHIVYVGKQGGSAASAAQAEISALLVEYAQQGKNVVRLKGGDVSLFSHISDELTAVTAHNIAYSIIPGVTSALGAAAYAGIPLTARGYASGVRFLTCYKRDMLQCHNWQELAHTDDTLVFYMTSSMLEQIVALLTEHAIASDKLLAVVEQATTPSQRVSIIHPYSYAQQAPSSFLSPSLVIVGKVVALHGFFGWYTGAESAEPYFPPVEYHNSFLYTLEQETYAG